jgi:hypothetical protein
MASPVKLRFNTIPSIINNEVLVVYITSGYTRIGPRVRRVSTDIKLGASGADSLDFQMD